MLIPNHKFAIEQAANFVKIAEGKALDVRVHQCFKIAEENRKGLKPLSKQYFCAEDRKKP